MSKLLVSTDELTSSMDRALSLLQQKHSHQQGHSVTTSPNANRIEHCISILHDQCNRNEISHNNKYMSRWKKKKRSIDYLNSLAICTLNKQMYRSNTAKRFLNSNRSNCPSFHLYSQIEPSMMDDCYIDTDSTTASRSSTSNSSSDVNIVSEYNGLINKLKKFKSVDVDRCKLLHSIAKEIANIVIYTSTTTTATATTTAGSTTAISSSDILYKLSMKKLLSIYTANGPAKISVASKESRSKHARSCNRNSDMLFKQLQALKVAEAVALEDRSKETQLWLELLKINNQQHNDDTGSSDDEYADTGSSNSSSTSMLMMEKEMTREWVEMMSVLEEYVGASIAAGTMTTSLITSTRKTIDEEMIASISHDCQLDCNASMKLYHSMLSTATASAAPSNTNNERNINYNMYNMLSRQLVLPSDSLDHELLQLRQHHYDVLVRSINACEPYNPYKLKLKK